MVEVDALADDLIRLDVNPFDADLDKAKIRRLLFAVVSAAQDHQRAGQPLAVNTAAVLNRLVANVDGLSLTPLEPKGEPTDACNSAGSLQTADLAKLSKRAKPFALAVRSGNLVETLADPDMAAALVPGDGTEQADLTPTAASLFARMVWTPAEATQTDPVPFFQAQMDALLHCEDPHVRVLLTLRICQAKIPHLVPDGHRAECKEFWRGLETLVLHIFGRGGSVEHSMQAVLGLLASLRQRMLGANSATPEQETQALGALLDTAESGNIWLQQAALRDIWSLSIFDRGHADKPPSPWGALLQSPRAQRQATKALVEAQASAPRQGQRTVAVPNPSSAARQLMVSSNLAPGWVQEVRKHWCPQDVALPGSCPGAHTGECPCQHMTCAQDAKHVVQAVRRAQVLPSLQWFTHLSTLMSNAPLLSALQAAVRQACQDRGAKTAPGKSE